MSASPAVIGANPLRGIALKVVSVAVFVAMSALIKAAGQLPAGQIVFFRSFFAVLPILAVLAWRSELRTALHTANPLGHIARGVVGVTAMGLGFFALTRLPLPEAITLNYAQPLLVVVFSALFLGETIRIYRWSAVAVGLAGVVIISWPKLTLFAGEGGMESQQALGVLAALAGAAVSAVAMLLVRRLVQTERTPTIVLWFSLTASAMAPFEYTSMILAIAVGYLAFGDVPTAWTIVGGLIVVAAGVFIIWRERQLGLERGRARKVAPPQ